ncbi:tRNA-splicing endonuclease catalytic subunit Sen34 [Schizosaccharomyces cryophilus OY26]|uniref:tRNA-splicing endonuclease subunit Sen34 n=1 Tax=Schizosaccharomyces cryophilus (strain OY26 / ATCC MYA-4695 / CBS 11777 / NBRC 106824 / NRRL Y48691) TaxID=653667 RepID=S9X9L9_SCHCR|nr:tRNA-splicing endonuclease catalytic subunit Sen34 [Schizosaccharomyces cryophilus OY26]EPY53832.1 tRNA-splicing endonuclease catalytic subunit Sen34 [Schizosaccharomyces cryophilus OY26]
MTINPKSTKPIMGKLPFNMNDAKYPISYIQGKYLLFDVEAIQYFRQKYHILGILSGTLPQLPQQNIFLGLPLQLTNEEVYYLVNNGAAYIIDDQRVHIDYFNGLVDDDRKFLADKRQKMAIEQLLTTRAKENEKKIKIMKKINKEIPLDTLEYDPTQPVNLTMVPVDTNTKELNRDHLETFSLGFPEIKRRRYLIFESLVNNGFFLNPGLRFGCDFVAYPGDPLRFHSHYLVNGYNWNDEIPLLLLIGGGRLGTGVKKAWLIGGEEEEQEMHDSTASDENNSATTYRQFSVEWSGFG